MIKHNTMIYVSEEGLRFTILREKGEYWIRELDLSKILEISKKDIRASVKRAISRGFFTEKEAFQKKIINKKGSEVIYYSIEMALFITNKLDGIKAMSFRIFIYKEVKKTHGTDPRVQLVYALRNCDNEMAIYNKFEQYNEEQKDPKYVYGKIDMTKIKNNN